MPLCLAAPEHDIQNVERELVRFQFELPRAKGLNWITLLRIIADRMVGRECDLELA